MQRFENGQGLVGHALPCCAVGTLLLAIAPAFSGTSAQGHEEQSWTAAQALEKRVDPVLLHAQAIDDAGAVTALFVQSDGTRSALFATRSSVGIDGNPSFSKPNAIDAAWPVLDGSTISIAAAPNGNVVAAWLHVAPCNDFTYMKTGNCRYLYTARYSASAGKWAAPVLVVDTPGDAPPLLNINDAGDVVLKMTGWIRNGNGYKSFPALAWRKHSASLYAQRVFSDTSFKPAFLGLDAAGDMATSGTNDDDLVLKFVAYRGSVSKGLGEGEILDDGSTGHPSPQSMSVGTAGQIVFVWDNESRYAATASTFKAEWSVAKLDMNAYITSTWAVPAIVTDTGTAIVYDLDKATYVTGSGGVWSKAHALPAGYPKYGYEPGISRNGSLLMVVNESGGFYGPDGGAWVTYDATTGKITHPLNTTSPGPGYVLGVKTSSNVDYGLPLLSTSGIGATIMRDDYDVLPSADDPGGIQGNTENLWAAVLR